MTYSYDLQEVEKGYDKKQVDSRLSRLNLARQAVRQPREIWDQGNQIVYIQAYRKKTGGKQGVLVFVEKPQKKQKHTSPKMFQHWIKHEKESG